MTRQKWAFLFILPFYKIDMERFNNLSGWAMIATVGLRVLSVPYEDKFFTPVPDFRIIQLQYESFTPYFSHVG